MLMKNLLHSQFWNVIFHISNIPRKKLVLEYAMKSQGLLIHDLIDSKVHQYLLIS